MPNQEFFLQVDTTFQKIHDKICQSLIKVSGENYQEDCWNYERGKGGGRTRIFKGSIIEKGGVNFSSIQGKFNTATANKFTHSISPNRLFQVCGVSVIIHPYNPFVPAVHLNVRFFQSGAKQWFGGGIDLNPYYPFIEDIIFFHRQLKKTCDSFDKNYYPEFKKNCDQYFYNKHRKESRGVGGIFFDQLNAKNTFDFVKQIAEFLITTYPMIVKKRMNSSFDKSQRQYQAYRRARYVEFNLLYDKGTAFGLQTGGRVESIFLSLPPNARWDYDFFVAEDSEEKNHQKYFQPQNWI